MARASAAVTQKLWMAKQQLVLFENMNVLVDLIHPGNMQLKKKVKT